MIYFSIVFLTRGLNIKSFFRLQSTQYIIVKIKSDTGQNRETRAYSFREKQQKKKKTPKKKKKSLRVQNKIVAEFQIKAKFLRVFFFSSLVEAGNFVKHSPPILLSSYVFLLVKSSS